MQRKLVLYIVILLILIFPSCVVNKKFQYLQKDDVNMSRNELPKDSLMRTYALDSFTYRIQPQDLLSIQVYSITEPEFNFFSLKTGRSQNGNTTVGQTGGNGSQLIGYLVDPEGNIAFASIGKISVAGLSVFEAQEKIRMIATNYLKDPVCEVRLLNFRFTVLGEVRSEGVYISQNNRVSILEALGLAGGLTDYADKANVKLIRQQGSEAKVYYLNLLDEELMNSEYYYINQNDVLVVAPLRQRPYQTYFGRNLALFLSSVSLLLIVINLTK